MPPATISTRRAAGWRRCSEQQAGIAAQLGGDPAAPIERHPRYLAAVAARDRAAHDLDQHGRPGLDRRHRRRVCLAPAGRVSGGGPGGLRAGRAPISLDRGQPEGNRSDLGAAGPAGDRLRSTPIPASSGAGRSQSVSPASQAQFSLLPAQNTSGNWVKVVQRIPLRVAVEPEAGAPPLRAGMSAEIEVDTGHSRRLARPVRLALRQERRWLRPISDHAAATGRSRSA